MINEQNPGVIIRFSNTTSRILPTYSINVNNL